MARGRMRFEWDQTATLWQVLAEANRDAEKRSEPFTIFDIHPLRRKDGDKVAEKEAQEGGRFWTDIDLAASLPGNAKSAVVHSILERMKHAE